MTRGKQQVKPRSEVFRSAALEAKPGMGPSDTVLLDEACRLLDRLDEMAGDRESWGEARAHTAELRQVLKALDLPTSKAAEAAPSKLELLLGGASG